MSIIKRLWIRDWQIYVHNISESSIGIIFFVIVISMFAISSKVTIETVWCAMLLSNVLVLQNLFKNDFELGFFEYLLQYDFPFSLLILTKITVHWCVMQLPLILLTPIFMGISSQVELLVMLATLVLGTIILSLIGAIAAALTVALPRGGVLLGVLVLPLYVPVLIIGSSCCVALQQGLPYAGYLAILLAITLLTLFCAPLAVSSALRINLT